MRAGFPLTPDMVARYFTGRRPADMFAEVEFATGRKLPAGFAAGVADSILTRFRSELRPTHHAAYALSWLRGPKCVVKPAPRRRQNGRRVRDLHRRGRFTSRCNRRCSPRNDGDWFRRRKPRWQRHRRSVARRWRLRRDYGPASAQARHHRPARLVAPGSALTRLRGNARLRFRRRLFLFRLQPQRIKSDIHDIGVDKRGGLRHRK